jgi:hypothetical protein
MKKLKVTFIFKAREMGREHILAAVTLGEGVT